MSILKTNCKLWSESKFRLNLGKSDQDDDNIQARESFDTVMSKRRVRKVLHLPEMNTICLVHVAMQQAKTKSHGAYNYYLGQV